MKNSRLAAALAGVDRRKIRNMGWIYFQQGSSLVMGFLLMVFLARYLGPDRLAVYAWVFSLVMLMAPLAASAEPLITRRIVETPESTARILGSGLALRLLGALLGAALVLAYAAVARPTGVSMTAIWIAVIMLPATALLTFDAWFRAKERISVVAVPKALAVSLGAVGGLGLIFAGVGLLAFFWIRTLQSLGTGLVSAIWYVFRGPRLALRVSRTELASLFSEGWPLIAAGLTSAAHLRIDQIMLGALAPLPMLADYSLAARLAEIPAVFHVALSAAFYPSLVRAHKKDPKSFDTHMQRYYDLHSMAGYLSIFLLIFAGLVLFVPVFGEAYQGGVVLVCILSLAVPMQFFDSARGAMLTIRGWGKTAFLVSGWALTINILANLFLIPTFGAAGAAWATVGSTWLTFLCLPFVLPWLKAFRSGVARSLVPWRACQRVFALARGTHAED